MHTPIEQPADGRVLDPDNRTYNALLRGLRCLGERGRRQPPSDLPGYIQLTAARLGVQRVWTQLLDRYPLLLGPVSTELPPPPSVPVDADEQERMMSPLRLCTVTALVGVPAAAVPAGVIGGLPQGVQVIGRMYREDLCLTAASAIEQRL